MAGEITNTHQLIINVPDGTSPMNIKSTTEVANLNSSYLSGYVWGNSANQIPLRNGTVNQKLNSEYLNGYGINNFIYDYGDIITKYTEFEILYKIMNGANFNAAMLPDYTSNGYVTDAYYYTYAGGNSQSFGIRHKSDSNNAYKIPVTPGETLTLWSIFDISGASGASIQTSRVLFYDDNFSFLTDYAINTGGTVGTFYQESNTVVPANAKWIGVRSNDNTSTASTTVTIYAFGVRRGYKQLIETYDKLNGGDFSIAGGSILPIVLDSRPKSVSVSNIQQGRAFIANDTGNIYILNPRSTTYDFSSVVSNFGQQNNSTSYFMDFTNNADSILGAGKVYKLNNSITAPNTYITTARYKKAGASLSSYSIGYIVGGFYSSSAATAPAGHNSNIDAMSFITDTMSIFFNSLIISPTQRKYAVGSSGITNGLVIGGLDSSAAAMTIVSELIYTNETYTDSWLDLQPAYTTNACATSTGKESISFSNAATGSTSKVKINYSTKAAATNVSFWSTLLYKPTAFNSRKASFITSSAYYNAGTATQAAAQYLAKLLHASDTISFSGTITSSAYLHWQASSSLLTHAKLVGGANGIGASPGALYANQFSFSTETITVNFISYLDSSGAYGVGGVAMQSGIR